MKLISKIKSSLLFRNTFVYTIFQLVNSGIPFLLLPILTRYLTPHDYGIISKYNTYVVVVAIFIELSMAGAIGVSFFRLKKEKLKTYIGNVFTISIVSLTLLTAVTTIFNSYISRHLHLPISWLYIGILVTWLQMVTNINLILWRSQQKAKPFAIYATAQTIVNISLSLFLIVSLQYDWQGRTIGTAVAAIVFGMISVINIYKTGYISFKVSKKYIKDILKFGIPLIPHQLALWARVGVDIVLITMILGDGQAGLYNVGFQFGMVVGLFAATFNNAYSPFLYKKLKDITQETKVNLVKFTYLYMICIIVFAILLSFFFIWLIPYYLGEKYQGASEFILLISLAYAFQGMYLMVVNYIFYTKKTHLISSVTISTSILHVFLSYNLIHEFGTIGAAYASVVSFFLTFLFAWIMSNKAFNMPWFSFMVAR